MVLKLVLCPHCRGQNVIRHGKDGNGVQRYRCCDCARTFREDSGSAAHPEAFREQVLAAYQERPSTTNTRRLTRLAASWHKCSA